MSRSDAVVLVSRALALYFLTWALTELSHLPAQALLIRHYASQPSVWASGTFWRNYEVVAGVFTLVRIVVLAVAAFLFFRCGPHVQRLLLPGADNQE